MGIVIYIYLCVCVFNVRYLKTMLLSLFFRGIVLNMCTYIYSVCMRVCVHVQREMMRNAAHMHIGYTKTYGMGV